MNAINKELFEKILPNISSISKYFSKYFVVKGFIFWELSILYIPLSDKKVNDLTTFITDKMQFKPKELAHSTTSFYYHTLRTVAFKNDIPEHFPK